MITSIKKIYLTLFIVMFILISNATAATFEELSKSFIILESVNGSKYLSIAVKEDQNIYAISSQSLFLNKISRIKLRAFKSGKVLKTKGFEVDKKGDYIRFKLMPTNNIIPLFIANKALKNEIFIMNPTTGIIFQNSLNNGNKINIKNASLTSGAPIINTKGEFVGIASREDKSPTGNIKSFIKLNYNTDHNWISEKPLLFFKKVYSLENLRNELLAINYLNNSSQTKNSSINFHPTIPPKFNNWMGDQNRQHLLRLTDPPKSVQQKSKDSCIHYTQMKRVLVFYKSINYSLKRGKWQTIYLKNLANSLYAISNKHRLELLGKTSRMLKSKPSLKIKF